MKPVASVVIATALLLLCGCRPFRPNPELLNGDFAQPLSAGWVQESGGDAGSSGFELSSDLGQPDTGNAVRITRTGAGFARLSQTVSIDNDAYRFGFTARLAIGGSLSCGPVAAVVLRYQDDAGRELGSTRWYLPSPVCDWTGSDTCHLVQVSDSQPWTRYEVGLADELTGSLPGITRDEVRSVTVELLAQVLNSG